MKLLPGECVVYPSVVCPMILRLKEWAADPVVGLPSPGALENPLGVSRTLSSEADTGKPGPGSGPSTSQASSNIWYDRSSGRSSTSIGWESSRFWMEEANSDSGGGYQFSFMSVTSWIPSSSSMDCFWESAGVSYWVVASCSSEVFWLIRMNPGGTLLASVGCRASGCPDER